MKSKMAKLATVKPIKYLMTGVFFCATILICSGWGMYWPFSNCLAGNHYVVENDPGQPGHTDCDTRGDNCNNDVCGVILYDTSCKSDYTWDGCWSDVCNGTWYVSDAICKDMGAYCNCGSP